jgi:hypothetical protein
MADSDKMRILKKEITVRPIPAFREKFSKEAISRAAKEFQKMAIERKEWVTGDEIQKVIKHADWRSDWIIIGTFGFTNYFKKGHSFYLNRKDLVALGKELKARNINLKVYQNLLEDQEKFEKLVKGTDLKKESKYKRYKIPEELRDINYGPFSPEIEEKAKKEIANLMEEFKKFDLSEYIDIHYKKTHAYYRYEYFVDRYVKPEVHKYCKDWCFRFNYANYALERILEIKKENRSV